MVEAASGSAVGYGGTAEPIEPYLSCWAANGAQRRWTLPADGGSVTIGRSADSDIRIEWDPMVSRVHAVVERIGHHWTIEDHGLSRNGTFVNGARLSHRVRLRDRDKIRLGETVLTYCNPPQTVTQQTVIGDAVRVPRLTDVQRSVVVALCRPYREGRLYAASNKEIADELSLSLDAVKTHLRILFQKFGIDDLPQNQKRARLVELARELGLDHS
jgi:pSer/pThr/pTyr-binding forkhead associated (FHA) protein